MMRRHIHRHLRVLGLTVMAAFLVMSMDMVTPISAMATVTDTPVFIQTPRAYKVQIVSASGTTAQVLAAGGPNGTKVLSIVASNTNSGAGYNVTISVLRGTTTYVLTTVNVPASSGNLASTPPVALLNLTTIPGLPVDSDGNPYIYLEPTDTLQASVSVAVTSGKAVSLETVAGDF